MLPSANEDGGGYGGGLCLCARVRVRTCVKDGGPVSVV